MTLQPDGAVYRNTGYIQWEKMKPGDTIEITRSQNSTVAALHRRFPGTRWSSTTKDAPEDKRIVKRET